MMKLALMVCSLISINHFGSLDLSTVAHLGDYGIALLITFLVMPWVARQFDS